MDSCQIFNLLFGTRKATSKLSKHFSSGVDNSDANQTKKNKSTNKSGSGSQECHKEEQPPSSPLKQIQMKIVNLATSSVNRRTESNCSHAQCDPSCGTYHAKLVEPSELGAEQVDENNNSNHLFQSQAIGSGVNANTQQSPKKVVLYDEPIDEGYEQTIIASAEVFAIKASNSKSGNQTSSARLDRVDDVGQSNENYVNGTRGHGLRDLRGTKSERVKSLVQSFEQPNVQSNQQSASEQSSEPPRTPIKLKWPPEQSQDEKKHKQKPITIVKPLPPKTPPKSNKVKLFNWQLHLSKPTKVEQLFQDDKFLARFFRKLEPIERCSAAQVCRSWRDVLYSNQEYWKDLISVIDCTQLRREYLLECIVNTLQTARLKYHNQLAHTNHHPQYFNQNNACHISKQASNDSITISSQLLSANSSATSFQYRNNQATMHKDFDARVLDQDEVWKIQELCQKFTRASNHSSKSLMSDHHQHPTANGQNQHQHDNQQVVTPKSSSIPSQISSTISSASLSSLLSPLSESSRVESIKEKLYTALDDRGFDALCLHGASDEDVEDLVSKTPSCMHKRILVGRLTNCCATDRGLDLFIKTFDRLEELELTNCNDITNSIEFAVLKNLKRLIITDCINIADGLAPRLIQIFHQLQELTIQAYNLTDAFLEYISLNSDTSRLRYLAIPDCQEVTNHSMITVAKYFRGVEELSLSGSKISDDGIELLGGQSKCLISLDLSWCTKITDVSLECIACDMSTNLRELILDRNINITDIGLGYLATMSNLTLLYIRWCPRISDIGLESVLNIKSLEHLSLAGLNQITARSLLYLAESKSLREVELTNCPAINNDLLEFLSSKMPKCNIIY